MRVMLDECVPVRLKHWLTHHDVETVTGIGWSGIKNGRLLQLLVDGGYEVFVTADTNLFCISIRLRRLRTQGKPTQGGPFLHRHIHWQRLRFAGG